MAYNVELMTNHELAEKIFVARDFIEDLMGQNPPPNIDPYLFNALTEAANRLATLEEGR